MLLQLKDSVFVTTNAIITPNQQIKECAEVLQIKNIFVNLFQVLQHIEKEALFQMNLHETRLISRLTNSCYFYQDPDIPESRCYTDKECKEGQRVKYGNGIFVSYFILQSFILIFSYQRIVFSSVGEMTGYCVQSKLAFQSTCQIKTWCPLENDRLG